MNDQSYDIEIGETATQDGKTYRAVAGSRCIDCAAHIAYGIGCGRDAKQLGNCDVRRRQDGTGIIFEEVDE